MWTDIEDVNGLGRLVDAIPEAVATGEVIL